VGGPPFVLVWNVRDAEGGIVDRERVAFTVAVQEWRSSAFLPAV